MNHAACDNYTRPLGVMGGTCLRCGCSQPEHVQRVMRQADVTEVRPLDLEAAREAVRPVVAAELQAERMPAWPDAVPEPPKRKANHLGAPACFALELACQHLRQAFGGCGAYQVGSSLARADYRDVDVRLILEDEAFHRLFPDAHDRGSWEFDPRWLVMTVAISTWLSRETGLPIDFQFQPQTHANEHHRGPRNPLGLRLSRRLQTSAEAASDTTSPAAASVSQGPK